ncbi:ABC transporter permease [Halogeometricum sp. S1BR25-6]|uniref:ABC transporter permease n=1 Tax=Halogeometricum salsisoli TaxID=2950536 RepID=A0ABU2GBW0_9EURY|nr:ABC transporter permease [Halogeometricum sp. S1BR25-6]MDS0298290.1 ABC transporter permease [Halogeometricum sp. S1BR25-6]
MATQDSPRFDTVDWDEITSESGREVTKSLVALAAILAGLAALFIYDYVAVPDRTATFAAVGWGYDVTRLDWLLALSLLFVGFYGILPLYRNKRMTRYYWAEFKKNRPAVVSLAFLAAVFVGGILGPLLISPPESELLRQFQPPVFMEIQRNYVIECVGEAAGGVCQGTWQHPLGTTPDGRDIFAMIVYGMQVSMKVGLIATLMAVVIGASVGTVSAYAGGMVDEVLMRYVDVQQSFPTLVLYLLIIYTWGGDLFTMVILFGLFSWEGTARYVRSNALAKTQEEYMKASRLSGAGTYRTIRRHLVPNTASSIITDATLLIPAFLLAEAQLSFLGLGDTSVASWGQLISIGRDHLSYAPWITLAPGLVLFLTILAFNFLGDALLDALNPEARAEAES